MSSSVSSVYNNSRSHESVTRVVVRAMSSVVASARRTATIASHVLPSLHACRVQGAWRDLAATIPLHYTSYLASVCVLDQRVLPDYAMCVTPQGDGGQASLGLWSRDLCRSSGTSHPWHCCIPRALVEAPDNEGSRIAVGRTTKIVSSWHAFGVASTACHDPMRRCGFHGHITSRRTACPAPVGSGRG